MAVDAARVKSLFLAASDLADPAERADYLDRECGGDTELRARVEALLRANDAAPLPPADAGDGTSAYIPDRESQTEEHGDPTARVGSILAGKYKLIEEIGEGGMGRVYMAQQIEPVKRAVAVKVIKAGMDSKAVLTRFEAERQALAMMDHPNIAKVLDAGTTDGGRPFFVMELVKGQPITKFCDECKLTPRQRLELFVPVCQAIQHAHQKGIIHRDIKPSNVLIAMYDDRPVPKVIDFGVAKAAGQALTDKTLMTGFGAVVGTPEYMSPEQANLNNMDIDTRSDVYSLGVLLYELLTGTTPVDKKSLGNAALLEILRIVREVEAPRPSAKLSTIDTLPNVAANRGTEPAKLSKLMKGELDWVPLKALEKDRARRYDTANGLARDIQRYLADELVEARPPTLRYRLKKAYRRNRVAVWVTSAFVALIVGAAAMGAVLAVQAKRAERLAEEKRIEAEANAGEAASWAYGAGINSAQLNIALGRAESIAVSRQVDLDLGELRRDPRVGLLRLARTLQTAKERQLREFVTMAVLATGQDYAPLLPPITHDGENVPYALINSKGDRLLTRGVDKTARLWDPFTGRQLAILRHADEKVIEAGLSPNGGTAFTHSLDGVVRLWETKDGAFRAAIDPRTRPIKSIDGGQSTSVEARFSPLTKTQLSNERVLTSRDTFKGTGEKHESSQPVELWDAKTGRFIARLGLSKIDAGYDFIGNGRWIESHDPFGREKMCPVFSAEGGRLVAKLNHDEKYGSPRSVPTMVSPSGRRVATVSEIGQNSGPFYVHLWDTTSWQLLSITGPLKWGDLVPAYFEVIADDLFTMSQMNGTTGVFRAGTATPIAELPGSAARFLGDRVLLDSGQLFDTQTWRRLQPPKGRKYHPEITRFAPDGRFVPVKNDRGEFQFLDSMTEKTSFTGSFPSFYQARLGWVGRLVCPYDNNSEGYLHRLPPPDQLDIPPDLLELWAQVAVRGQLDDEGGFVKWDEPTWERKRQELAAKPAPDPDFPFPGHVAQDRLHWLRQEYENASDVNKPGLARQFLDRCEAAGDKVEAVRWRAILTPKPPAKKPTAQP